MSASVASRAERLVRALTGVLDARVDAAPNGRITGVHVVPETGFSPHRVTQNVRSGLMAATGIVLEPARVYIVRALPETAAPTTKAEPVARERLVETGPLDDFEPPADDFESAPIEDAEPAILEAAATIIDLLAPAPVETESTETQSVEPTPQAPQERIIAARMPQAPVPSRPDPLAPLGTPATEPRQNGKNGSQPHEPPAHPAWPVFNHYGTMPRVELLEMQRDETGAPRCRIVIESDGRRFLGTATNVRGGETTADLIAGAIVHALESLIPCDLHFDGMADVIIAGQRHVVVSLRNTSDWSHALSGAAPVHDSVEHAIANAILNAIGIGIAHTYSFMNRLVNHR